MKSLKNIFQPSESKKDDIDDCKRKRVSRKSNNESLSFGEFIHSNKTFFEKFISSMHLRFKELELPDIIKLSNKLQVLFELLSNIL